MATIAVPDGVRLNSEPAAVAVARDYARERCSGLPGDTCDNVRLVVSELVGNSVRHARSAVCVGVEVLPDVVRVHVADSSPEPPHPRSAGLFDEGGRGLLLVDAIALRWGVIVAGEGKRVWAEIPIEPRR